MTFEPEGAVLLHVGGMTVATRHIIAGDGVEILSPE